MTDIDEFYDEVIRKTTVPVEQHIRTAPPHTADSCPVCGVEKGMAFGTGDCNCVLEER